MAVTEVKAAGAPAATGLWQKLRSGLARTQARLTERIGAALDLKPRLDDVTLADPEEALIGADLGLGTVELLLDRLRELVLRADVAAQGRLRQLLAEEIELLLREGNEAAAHAVAGAGRPVGLAVKGTDFYIADADGTVRVVGRPEPANVSAPGEVE